MASQDAAELIESYFAACTNGIPEEIAEHFTDDAVIYDTNHHPLSHAGAIGEFFASIRSQWSGAAWTVNTIVADDDQAAIEWTMIGRRSGREFAMRGSEHYEIVDGKIDQIRQYWTFDSVDLDTALIGYPYETDKRFNQVE